MNKKTLKDLGYFQVIEILKGFSRSTLGAMLCDELIPYDDYDLAVREGKRVSQLKRALSEVKGIPFGEISDIKDALELSKIGNSILGIESIVHIKDNLFAAGELKMFLNGLDK